MYSSFIHSLVPNKSKVWSPSIRSINKAVRREHLAQPMQETTKPASSPAPARPETQVESLMLYRVESAAKNIKETEPSNARARLGFAKKKRKAKRRNDASFWLAYSETPVSPRPPQTPSHSRGWPVWLGPPDGDQLMFETSYSLCQTAAGPRSEVVDGGAPVGCVGGDGMGAALCWLIRSHRRTMLSSPPDARMPRRLGDHSTQLRAAEWPFSSSRAWPGCRTSRTRTTLESWENVAKRWASCGDA